MASLETERNRNQLMSKLTPQEIASCVAILRRLEPGILPLEIFNQVARLVCLPMVDVVPMKYEGLGLSIGLVEREEDDLWWPNLWHLPGTVLRSTDTVETAIQRLMDSEIAIKTSSAQVFRGFSVHRSERGSGLILIYTIENCLFKKTSAVKWFSIDHLPKEFVSSESYVIEKIKESLAHDGS